MRQDLLNGPALEPVRLDEVISLVGGVEGDEEFLLSCLIVAARVFLEAEVGCAFIAQKWSIELDVWPASGVFVLPQPLAPFSHLNKVSLCAFEGDVDLPLDSVAIDDSSGWPLCTLADNDIGREFEATASAIKLEVTVGYGESAEDVPANLRQAILALTRHWYLHRQPVGFGSGTLSVPHEVFELIAPYRSPELASRQSAVAA